MSKEIYVVGCQEDVECGFTTREAMQDYLKSLGDVVTTKAEFEKVKKGDTFYVWGDPYVAREDVYQKDMNGFGFMECVVHDVDGNEFCSGDFPYSKANGWWGRSLRVYESVEEVEENE